jgi:hypothetical protein
MTVESVWLNCIASDISQDYGKDGGGTQYIYRQTSSSPHNPMTAQGILNDVTIISIAFPNGSAKDY